MFDLIAGILAYFYELVHSYAGAILMLTFMIMVLFTPLIIKSTKSMLEMRALQPHLKALQKKYADDRQKLQQEQMALYQANGVNPVGGCLPMLFQAPVFLVVYRVINGLTRRIVDTGFATGNGVFKRQLAQDLGVEGIALKLDPAPAMRFNPQYLNHDAEMYRDLSSSTEMESFGIDLSRSASQMLGVSVVQALPYILLVLLVGGLGMWQHRQIQGRNAGAEMNPQMELITKIMPYFLPVFAFTLPAAMSVYFAGQSVVRVAQQYYISRRFYGEGGLGHAHKNVVEDLDEDDEESDDTSGADTKPGDNADARATSGGLLGALMGGQQQSGPAESRHGSRRPVTTSARRSTSARRPTPSSSRTTQKSTDTKKPASASSKRSGDLSEASSEGLWARARRRAAGESQADTPTSTTRVSKRVTEPGSTPRSNKQKRK